MRQLSARSWRRRTCVEYEALLVECLLAVLVQALGEPFAQPAKIRLEGGDLLLEFAVTLSHPSQSLAVRVQKRFQFPRLFTKLSDELAVTHLDALPPKTRFETAREISPRFLASVNDHGLAPTTGRLASSGAPPRCHRRVHTRTACDGAYDL